MGLPCWLQVEPDIYARLRMYLAVESLWYLGQVWHIAALLNSQLDTVDRKLTEYSRWLLTCEACTAIGVGAAFQLHRGLGHTEYDRYQTSMIYRREDPRRDYDHLWPLVAKGREDGHVWGRNEMPGQPLLVPIEQTSWSREDVKQIELPNNTAWFMENFRLGALGCCRGVGLQVSPSGNKTCGFSTWSIMKCRRWYVWDQMKVNDEKLWMKSA